MTTTNERRLARIEAAIRRHEQAIKVERLRLAMALDRIAKSKVRAKRLRELRERLDNVRRQEQPVGA